MLSENGIGGVCKALTYELNFVKVKLFICLKLLNKTTRIPTCTGAILKQETKRDVFLSSFLNDVWKDSKTD